MIFNVKTLRMAICLIGGLFFSPILFAAPQLIKLNVNELTAGKFEIKFEFNAEIGVYTDKLTYKPNELIIYFDEASSLLKLNPVNIDKGGVKTIETKPIKGGLRVVLALKGLMQYRIDKKGNTLYVRFGSASEKKSNVSESEKMLRSAVAQHGGEQVLDVPIVRPQTAPKIKATGKTPQGYVNSIKSIDFKRGSEGQGKLLVYLDNSSAAVDLRRRDDKLIAEFKSTFIPNDFLYIMDVVDFATVVDSIETFKEKDTTRFVFSLKDKFNYRYDQLDTLFMIEVTKKPETEHEDLDQGKAISLNFQDIPVRTVLQLIADFNDFNLVITDSVSGNITLRLDDIPWEQALDIILKAKGLGKRMHGNVLMIAPANELAEKERDQLESAKNVAQLSPLYAEFIQINYAKAIDIATMLSSENTSLLSVRGAVSVDERTNTLLLKDTATVIDAVKEMIEVLDIPVRQVVIEARMVTVSDSVGEELGVKWGVSTPLNSPNSIHTSGSTYGNYGIGDSPKDILANRLNVNLPVAAPAGQIAFQVAKFANGQVLDLELSALEKENKAEIIASPRITTANQQTAYIEQGTEIPYTEASSSGASSVSFKKAVLSLQVTPQITPDNKVILDLVITQDSVGDIIPTGVGQAVSIDTQEIGTQVLVDNGETIVLGGIYQQRISNGVIKVPVLGDIPYLGVLFRTTIKSSRKAELLIFVTPRIVMQTDYR